MAELTMFQIVLGIIDVLACIALVIVIMFQSAKNANSSAAVTGGQSEAYFSKGKTRDGILSKWTTVLAIVFAVVIILLNMSAIIFG